MTQPESVSIKKEQKTDDPDQRDYEITRNQIRNSKLDAQLLVELQQAYDKVNKIKQEATQQTKINFSDSKLIQLHDRLS